MPDKQPAGGFDGTPLPPRSTPGYDVQITFHSATNLPMSDLETLSSDPYLYATVTTDLATRHKQDDELFFRSRTRQRTTEPVWDEEWKLANVPSTGFKLKVRMYDEDPSDTDDRLGNVHIHVGDLSNLQPIDHKEYKIEKKSGSWRAYAVRYCAVGLHHKQMHGGLVVSIKVLGQTKTSTSKVYTIGPNYWRQHYSPLIGRLTGTKGGSSQDGVEKYDFEANQIQLAGPVPDDLYHRFVEFKGFVKGMFTATGLRGKPLHYLLHHQHNNIYAYNKNTAYGKIEEPGADLAKQFLKMVHHSEGHRIYTYVILLDGLMRFTETGKEFGIDLLSKHTMHSDVSQYIACSGEFLVRKRQGSDEKSAPVAENDGNDVQEQPVSGQDGAKDPSQYELLIDNDSGTYRPKTELLPQLQKFLESNFVGLKIVAKACNDDAYQDVKKKQREAKKKDVNRRVYRQNSFASSVSSSDVSDLNDAAARDQGQGGDGLVEKTKRKTKKAYNAATSPKSGAMKIAEKV